MITVLVVYGHQSYVRAGLVCGDSVSPLACTEEYGSATLTVDQIAGLIVTALGRRAKQVDAVVNACPGGAGVECGLVPIEAFVQSESDRAGDSGWLLAGVARKLSLSLDCPAFVYRECLPVLDIPDTASITGFPEIRRSCAQYATDAWLAAKYACMRRKIDFFQSKVIAVSSGDILTLVAISNGQIIDTVDSREEGPFYKSTSGGVAARQVIERCFERGATPGRVAREMIDLGGMRSYLGTSDFDEVARRISAGDYQARLVVDAMMYQVAREIGALAATFCGRVDLVVLSGELAGRLDLVRDIERRVGFVAPVAIATDEDILIVLAHTVQAANKGA